MNSIQNIFKSPMLWVLAAGILVGAGAVATTKRDNQVSTFRKEPSVSISDPKPIGQFRTESLDMVKALDESFANLADSVKPSVVHIRSRNTTSRNAQGERQSIGGEGSGVIFRSDGYIVTNDHVVGGYEQVLVTLYDGREFPGKVIRAEDSDIAVVKIDAKDLPALPFAESNNVRSGEFAMAVGAPFGLDNTVTVGHISATQRTNQIPDPTTGKFRAYWDLIQTDTPINMGNSGGPLVNIEGQVVGINTAIFSATGTSGGIGFAISSNQARLLAETLIEKGKVARGFLGIQPENLKGYQKKELGLTGGALVVNIPNDGPAAKAGIKKGDVVLRIGNVPVASQVDIRNAMIKYGPGSKLEIEVLRDREHKTFSVIAKDPPVMPTENDLPQSADQPGLDLPEAPGFEDSPRVQSPDQSPSTPMNRARLGVEIGSIDETAKKTFKIPDGVEGAVVNSVSPRSVADREGMKIGDVVTEFDGKAIKGASDLAAQVAKVNPGERKRVKFLRFERGTRTEYDRQFWFR
ncbi:MAG: trypsin-like peptidase domain-containing protein [Fimbriimonadaceae bacterium]|nr:trypsin-like peptidase domain-containing protein [Fimbriimonadaceae bacterium]